MFTDSHHAMSLGVVDGSRRSFLSVAQYCALHFGIVAGRAGVHCLIIFGTHPVKVFSGRFSLAGCRFESLAGTRLNLPYDFPPRHICAHPALTLTAQPLPAALLSPYRRE